MLLRPIPPSYRPFKVHSSFFWAPLNQWHMNIFSLLLIKTSGWNLSIIFSGTLILLAHNPVNMCLRKHILKPGLNSLLLETACRVFCGVFFFSCEFVYFWPLFFFNEVLLWLLFFLGSSPLQIFYHWCTNNYERTPELHYN